MKLITDNNSLRNELDNGFQQYDKYYIAVAWLKDLYDDSILRHKDKIACLLAGAFNNSGYITNLSTISYIEQLKDCDNVRLLASKGYNKIFHPKVLFFASDDFTDWKCIIGSYNLGKMGLTHQIQTSVLFSSKDDPDGTLLKNVLDLFETRLVSPKTTSEIKKETFLQEARKKARKKVESRKERNAAFVFDVHLFDKLIEKEKSLLGLPTQDDILETLDELVYSLFSQIRGTKEFNYLTTTNTDITREEYDKLIKIFESKNIPFEKAIMLMPALRTDVFPLFRKCETGKPKSYEQYWERVETIKALSNRFFSEAGVKHKALLYGLYDKGDYNDIFDTITKKLVEQYLNSGQLPKLHDHHKKVLYEYLTQDKTLAEIGVSLGCSRERIRQIKDKALKKFRGKVKYAKAPAFDVSDVLSTYEIWPNVPTSHHKAIIRQDRINVLRYCQMISELPEQPIRPIRIKTPEARIFEGLEDICNNYKRETNGQYALSKNTMKEIAEKKPKDIKSLSIIKGFGRKKIKNFGNAIIELVKNISEEEQG